MKKIEFSKLILIVIYLTAVVLTGFTGYLLLRGADIGSYSPIILAVWAELGTSSGFYYWKARTENKIKLLKDLPNELQEKAKEILDEEK